MNSSNQSLLSLDRFKKFKKPEKTNKAKNQDTSFSKQKKAPSLEYQAAYATVNLF